ncbi:sn-glycerol-3-phosphate ABC transporter ATP-binding protein UgpC [Myxococcota bacterium]|nr:sn-glycerol-3-phosphate ABC transporter ATP-binding protein UgpC [Myxococcota bacterium]
MELRGVEKRYERQAVIHGVDLTVGDGEFLVLVGPSGCGKSTLLRMIAGLEEIDAGDLLIDGRRANDLRPRDRDLAMVFQSYALYPHMSVGRNLAFALELARVPREEVRRRVAEAAEILGLADLLDRLPRQLSGGQRQRVAMGRAIVRRPRAFLFDEPLSNLDAALRGRMRVELKRLHQRLSATSIYVTHDQVEAMTLADRIAVLKGGRLQQVGTPAELYARPGNRFVAGFIGSPEMNFLPATATGTALAGRGFVVETLVNSIPSGHGVHVGARPHDLVLGKGEGPGLMARGRLDVVEPLGWEAHLHVRIGEEAVVARVEAREAATLRPGDELSLFAPLSSVHLFDAGSGARIGD